MSKSMEPRDGHAILHNARAMIVLTSDGGPMRYRERGVPLPDKYLPGRYFMSMSESTRDAVIKAVSNPNIAPWALKLLCGE